MKITIRELKQLIKEQVEEVSGVTPPPELAENGRAVMEIIAALQIAAEVIDRNRVAIVDEGIRGDVLTKVDQIRANLRVLIPMLNW